MSIGVFSSLTFRSRPELRVVSLCCVGEPTMFAAKETTENADCAGPALGLGIGDVNAGRKDCAKSTGARNCDFALASILERSGTETVGRVVTKAPLVEVSGCLSDVDDTVPATGPAESELSAEGAPSAAGSTTYN